MLLKKSSWEVFDKSVKLESLVTLKALFKSFVVPTGLTEERVDEERVNNFCFRFEFIVLALLPLKN